jgi:CheY-like chemotaxis protein
MTSAPRVLVVDDEAPVRRQLKVGLVQHGYQVEESEEGLDALAKIRSARTRTPFDFVVLDICLPDIDGLRLLSAIKGTYPQLPVVVISGYGTDATADCVEGRSGSAYLDKPFEVSTLVAEFTRIAHPEGVEPARIPEIPPALRPLESTFVFAKARPGADVFGLFMRLTGAEGICYCDPLVGDWDLAVLLQAPDRRGIERLIATHLESSAEVGAYEVHACERPRLPRECEAFLEEYDQMQAAQRRLAGEADRRKTGRLTAYAVLDVEPARLALLYMKLRFTDHVIYCDVTDGGRKVLLLLQAGLDQELQETIRNEIRIMPGVLRIKLLNVLNFWSK